VAGVRGRPEPTRRAARGLVCTVDHLASVAGVRLLAAGGSAADAAVAASAALAVTTQHMCGMGGDLWALVHHDPTEPPAALDASGRAGSGVDAAVLRAEGHTEMPFRSDLRSTPVPGCVDGWLALHERFGRRPLDEVLSPAIELAEAGFPASPLLAATAPAVAGVLGNDDFVGPDGTMVRTGALVRRPGLARALRAIATAGRSAWYEGDFGAGLVRVGAGVFTAADVARSHADWVEPVTVEAWGHRLWSTPPASQGYLSLAGAWVAEGLPLPADADDPAWPHLLAEAAKAVGWDRSKVLHEHADGGVLVDPARLGPRRDAIDPNRAAALAPPTAGGGTVYLCAVDADRLGVSLIQSNASGFGVHLTVPELGVFLHNRGLGFSLEPGHPAEAGPGRRPPSTLSPALVTRPDGSLRTVLGTMGGDTQPQTVLQLLAHLLAGGRSAGHAVSAPRFALTRDGTSFDTWTATGPLTVAVESGRPAWADGLARRGHLVDERPWGANVFGHAHVIEVLGDHLAGCADPRALVGAAVGL
jgi:gamma-glutamyltranspeptidase / glutathione hydrolase